MCVKGNGLCSKKFKKKIKIFMGNDRKMNAT